MDYQEVNFDGLVGPTHNYAALSPGNLASTRHGKATAYPRAAALQGLEKMWALAQRGFPQAVLPPQARPALDWLRHWGFSGTDAAVLNQVARRSPSLLATVSSASAMWTANAGTIAPSCDTSDRLCHLSPANLEGNLHRAIEAEQTARTLKAIFADEALFCHHRPLAGGQAMSDEGAANHTRFTPEHSQPGLHLMVYGRATQGTGTAQPRRFPARQTLEASTALLRRHRLPENQQLMLAQHPEAIDAGVFHHDVIGVGHLDWYLGHQQAWADPSAVEQLEAAYAALHDTPLTLTLVPDEAVSLAEAVQTYLFNSQLLKRPQGDFLLVAPEECVNSPTVGAYLEGLLADEDCPLGEVAYFDLRESMRNGGGPACLRWRVVLNAAEREAIHARVWLDKALYTELTAWVQQHYRESLAPEDLADPELLKESYEALDRLTQIMRLGSIYPFQQDTSSR